MDLLCRDCPLAVGKDDDVGMKEIRRMNSKPVISMTAEVSGRSRQPFLASRPSSTIVPQELDTPGGDT
jgi:hypothetical protein